MTCQAEKRIANGWMVLIPNLSETATDKELDHWAITEPKEYKIRIPDRDAEEMKERWGLDGQKVDFRNNHRPRARYLYWQFAVALLRKAYRGKHTEVNPITSEFGKGLWGTAGPWIKKKYLLGFVENLGHNLQWENLLQAAVDDEVEDCEADPAGVLQANKQLELVREQMEGGWPGRIPEVKKDDEEEKEDEGSETEVEDEK
ncbi:MAG: hypothetical protein Q9212_001896 [Teloschistes hypoglaucus]